MWLSEDLEDTPLKDANLKRLTQWAWILLNLYGCQAVLKRII